MRCEYQFYVYILQSASRRALYIGITNNLRRRVWQHKTHAFEGFSDDYNAVRLVYWERFERVCNAIAREKQLKGWRREKKLSLIRQMNPQWRDLAADWYETQGPLRLAALAQGRLSTAVIARTRAIVLARDDSG
jgi:putative endonuclease